MSDKCIQGHRYSSNDGTIIIKKIVEKSNRIDYKYEGQTDDQYNDKSMYFDDWEEGNYVDLTGEVPSTFTLTVLTIDDEAGSVIGGGIYPVNSIVQISASPKNGYCFLKWDDDNISNPRDIQVDKDMTFTAYFEEKQKPKFTITVKSNDEAQGSVDGGGMFYVGSVVEISAKPENGYVFKKWNDDSSTNPRNVPVEKDVEYTAYFEKKATAPDDVNITATFGNNSEKWKLLNRLLFQLEESKKMNLIGKTKDLRDKIIELSDQFDSEKKKGIIEKVNSILKTGINSDIFHSR
jgi:hypothetical protein